MTTYALDTNIVSYFLKNDVVVVQKINEEKDKRNKFVILAIMLDPTSGGKYVSDFSTPFGA
jgi:hypothetical protein